MEAAPPSAPQDREMVEAEAVGTIAVAKQEPERKQEVKRGRVSAPQIFSMSRDFQTSFDA